MSNTHTRPHTGTHTAHAHARLKSVQAALVPVGFGGGASTKAAAADIFDIFGSTFGVWAASGEQGLLLAVEIDCVLNALALETHVLLVYENRLDQALEGVFKYRGEELCCYGFVWLSFGPLSLCVRLDLSIVRSITLSADLDGYLLRQKDLRQILATRTSMLL